MAHYIAHIASIHISPAAHPPPALSALTAKQFKHTGMGSRHAHCTPVRLEQCCTYKGSRKPQSLGRADLLSASMRQIQPFEVMTACMQDLSPPWQMPLWHLPHCGVW